MPDLDTDHLIRDAAAGDLSARDQLLVRHYQRLRRMVALYLDRRLSARVDPSDVVQETIAEAHQKLADYLDDPPLPFYPWLRQLAWERLQKLHLRHIYAQKRSVRREVGWQGTLPADSAARLVEGLASSGTGPPARLERRELIERLRRALAELPDRDREILLLRDLERLSTRETAAVLGITETAVKVRRFRALQKLRGLLGVGLGDG